MHVQNGFNIFAALRCNRHAVPSSGSNFSSNDLKAIEDHIIPMFLRLNVLCSLAGKNTPPIYAPAAGEDSPQANLTDSRRRLYAISDTCLRFIGEASPKAAMFQIDVDDLAEQVRLQIMLDAWCDRLDELLQRMQAAGSPANLDALNMLLVHYKVIYIWIRVCTTAGETATDSYRIDFEKLLYYVEQIVKPDAGATIPQPLSFDTHVLGPLYYTALKCRHPTTRRRALKLLQLAPRREGLWNAHHAYVTAQRVIEMEEMHVNGQDLPDETSRVHGLPLPDDEARIYSSGTMHSHFGKFDHSIVPSPARPGILKAVFQTKPWGLSREWQTITEYIKL